MFEELVLKELVKNGYSRERGKRVWNISNHKLLYLTPQLAQGFLDLERFPRYKANVVDRELALIRDHVPKIFGGSYGKFNLIDLGCGDGLKAESFARSLPRTLKSKYFAIDVSLALTHLAADRLKRLRSSYFSVGKPIIEDFSSPEKLFRKIDSISQMRNIFLLLGSTLASFDVNDFLFHISKAMNHGDVIVIGNGIRTGKRFSGVEKYRNPLFNKWFMHLMNGLGFNESQVEYDARFAHGRLEFFYRIKSDKVFICNGKRIGFKAGDEIIVAVQYKYYANELQKFCEMYFTDVRFFKDKDSEYSLIFCIK